MKKDNLTLLKEKNELMKKAAYQYYTVGDPIMSDAQYDKLAEEYKNLEDETGIVLIDNPLHKVGSTILPSLEKVPITPVPMLSLEKCHTIKEILDFADGHGLVGMVKCDGLSIRLIYNNGKLQSANTRGDGHVGALVTEHVKQFYRGVPLTIPNKNLTVIDGEALILDSDFDSEEFANQRNAAAGALNLLDTSKVKERKLSFIAWDFIEGYKNSIDVLFENKLTQLAELGFDVVPYYCPIVYEDVDIPNNEYLIEKAKECGIPCDGVVWRLNDLKEGASRGATEHHFKNAIAWKPEIETVETELEDIEWTMGKTGILTPVALFTPINFNGSVISRASLHNVSILKSVLGKPYIGQKLKIYKANMIIPQVLEADKDNYVEDAEIEMIEFCPSCGEPIIIKNDNGTEVAYCNNDACGSKLSNKLDYFSGKKGLDIKGLSKRIYQKLIDNGFVNCILDIYDLKNHRDEWIAMPGFGEKSVDKYLDAIEKSKDTKLSNFISAISIPTIGPKAAKILAENFETWEDFRNAIGVFDFTILDGIGEKTASYIEDFDYTEADEIVKLMNFNEVEKKEDSTLRPVGIELLGKTFVITGKLTKFKKRSELVDFISAHGGVVSDRVNENTTALIINDSESMTRKAVSARELNIPLMSEDTFLSLFDK